MIPDLSFMIRANNMSGAAFAGVQRDLRKTDGMMASMAQRATRMGRSMRNVGLGMSAAVTAPMMLVFRDSLRLFDDQARAQAGVMAGVESTGGAAGFAADELFRMASGLQDMTRFGDENILKNVTEQMLTFTNIAGPQFEAAQLAVLDMATGMRKELAPTAIMVGKALNDPIAGLSALSKAGIQFTESQRDMISAMVEAGDVAGAQDMILAELNTQFGGKAVADVLAGAGAIAQLSNSWGDLKESIGAVLVPMLVPLVDTMRDMVKWFQALGPEQKKSIVMWGAIATALGPVLAIGGMAVIGFAGLAGGLMSLGPIIAGLLGPLGLLAAGLVAFGPEVLDGFSKAVDGIEMKTDGLIGVIGDTGTVLMDLANGDWAGAWEHMKESMAESASIIGNLVGSVGSVVGNMIAGVVLIFRGDWAGAWAAGGRVVDSLKQIVIDFIGAANFDSVVAGIKSMIEWFGNLLQPIKDAAAALANFNLLAPVTDLVGLTGGALRNPEPITDDAAGITFVDPAYLPGRASGGPVTAGQPYMVGEVGPELFLPDQNGTIISNNQMSGVQGMTQNVAAWFQQMFASIGPMTDNNLSSIMAKFSEMAGGVVDSVGDMANETSQLFDSMGQTISANLFDWLKTGEFTMDSFRSMVADTWSSIANSALSSALQPVQQGVGNAISGLLSGLFGGLGGGGAVSPNRNGAVVMGPAYFPTRGGMASMSEENPEAIMPLERGPGGRLGVRANGGGGASNVKVNITVKSNDPNTQVFQTSKRQTAAAARGIAGR